jgi:hypothetical protein
VHASVVVADLPLSQIAHTPRAWRNPSGCVHRSQGLSSKRGLAPFVLTVGVFDLAPTSVRGLSHRPRGVEERDCDQRGD